MTLYVIELAKQPGFFVVHGTIPRDQAKALSDWTKDRNRILDTSMRTNPVLADNLCFVAIHEAIAETMAFELRMTWDAKVVKCSDHPSFV